LQLTYEEIQNLSLLEIEKHLQTNRRSLKEYPTMPYPKDYVTGQFGNKLIYEELDYDQAIQQQQFQELFSSLTGYLIYVYFTNNHSLYELSNHYVPSFKN
jgi:hypothetical protein